MFSHKNRQVVFDNSTGSGYINQFEFKKTRIPSIRTIEIMNYLAHLFLAEDSPEAMIGNLLGDFVKGVLGDRYSPELTKGIRLHRKIDTYADSHPVTRSSRNRFSPERRRYAGIIVDVCYDHFLSKHWSQFADMELSLFISKVYGVLQSHKSILPEKLRSILPRMIQENWLGAYQAVKGVEMTLNRISRRLKRRNQIVGSIEEVLLHYEGLKDDFLAFFPDLIAYTDRCKR
jgi:acyl carrier protein phosphodiesterase